MKKLILALMLLVAVSFAANFSSLSNSTSLSNDFVPLTEHNSHWQLTDTNEVGCVRDGETVYGSNDDADLTWDGATIDISGYDGAAIIVQYTQIAADANDYCTMELNSGHGDLQFADAAIPTWVTFTVHTSISDLFVNFNWQSDASGFDTGFRMTTFQVVGANDGEGTFTEIFNWNSDMGLTTENHDVTGMNANRLACLSYTYNTNGHNRLWGWAIDDIVINVDGIGRLSENFEGYAWGQDSHGEAGRWYTSNPIFGGFDAPGSIPFFSCNSEVSNSTFNAETFSPWISAYGATAVTAEFNSQYQNHSGYDNAIFGYYTASGTLDIDEDWTNLNDWTTSDSGTSIEETTWGQLKNL